MNSRIQLNDFAVVSVFAILLFSFFAATNFKATAAADGEKLFNSNCAACHTAGKNSIDPKKPVIGSKKLASQATFKEFLSKANGSMPAFKSIAENAESLGALYTYVKTLK
jgi:mono/diheme cytochrome c family protein